MNNFKNNFLRVAAIIALIFSWAVLERTGWLASTPRIADSQTPPARVLSGMSNEFARSGLYFVSASESVAAVSPEEEGLFLYIGPYAKFYPTKIIKELGTLEDMVGNVPVNVTYSAQRRIPVVQLPPSRHIRYQLLTLREAVTRAPYLVVLISK